MIWGLLFPFHIILFSVGLILGYDWTGDSRGTVCAVPAGELSALVGPDTHWPQGPDAPGPEEAQEGWRAEQGLRMLRVRSTQRVRSEPRIVFLSPRVEPRPCRRPWLMGLV